MDHSLPTSVANDRVSLTSQITQLAVRIGMYSTVHEENEHLRLSENVLISDTTVQYGHVIYRINF